MNFKTSRFQAAKQSNSSGNLTDSRTADPGVAIRIAAVSLPGKASSVHSLKMLALKMVMLEYSSIIQKF